MLLLVRINNLSKVVVQKAYNHRCAFFLRVEELPSLYQPVYLLSKVELFCLWKLWFGGQHLNLFFPQLMGQVWPCSCELVNV